MSSPITQFEEVVRILLEKYEGTTINARWNEATSFGGGGRADAYWIRDSGYLVNIVWLNEDGIRDITLLRYPREMPIDESSSEILDAEYDESMFNYLPLTSIASFEVREGENVAHQFGLGVMGHKMVHVITNGPRGNLYWVAETEKESGDLDDFLYRVFSQYVHVLNRRFS